MGRHAGFLTAASVMARTREGDGPHLIYVPEGSANAILVLDQASGEVVRRIEGVPEVHGLAAGPDGAFLVAGSFAEEHAAEAPPKPEGVSDEGGEKDTNATINQTVDSTELPEDSEEASTVDVDVIE